MELPPEIWLYMASFLPALPTAEVLALRATCTLFWSHFPVSGNGFRLHLTNSTVAGLEQAFFDTRLVEHSGGRCALVMSILTKTAPMEALRAFQVAPLRIVIHKLWPDKYLTLASFWVAFKRHNRFDSIELCDLVFDRLGTPRDHAWLSMLGVRVRAVTFRRCTFEGSGPWLSACDELDCVEFDDCVRTDDRQMWNAQIIFPTRRHAINVRDVHKKHVKLDNLLQIIAGAAADQTGLMFPIRPYE